MELYIEKKPIERNPLNGKFNKGITPFVKGKKWDEWMPSEKRINSLNALKQGRGLFKGRILPPSIKRMKKILTIIDGKIIVHSSIHNAANAFGVNFKDISRACNINSNRNDKFRKVHGMIFFFEKDIEKWNKLLIS